MKNIELKIGDAVKTLNQRSPVGWGIILRIIYEGRAAIVYKEYGSRNFKIECRIEDLVLIPENKPIDEIYENNTLEAKENEKRPVDQEKIKQIKIIADMIFEQCRPKDGKEVCKITDEIASAIYECRDDYEDLHGFE